MCNVPKHPFSPVDGQTAAGIGTFPNGIAVVSLYVWTSWRVVSGNRLWHVRVVSLRSHRLFFLVSWKPHHNRISNRIMLNSMSSLFFLSCIYVRTSIICFYITFRAHSRGETDALRGTRRLWVKNWWGHIIEWWQNGRVDVCCVVCHGCVGWDRVSVCVCDFRSCVRVCESWINFNAPLCGLRVILPPVGEPVEMTWEQALCSVARSWEKLRCRGKRLWKIHHRCHSNLPCIVKELLQSTHCKWILPPDLSLSLAKSGGWRERRWGWLRGKVHGVRRWGGALYGLHYCTSTERFRDFFFMRRWPC